MTRWTRVRPPGVRGLEIWDRPFRGGQLWEHLGADAAARGTGAAGDTRGTDAARGADLADALAELVDELAPLGFDAVWVTGGLTLIPGVRGAFPARYAAPTGPTLRGAQAPTPWWPPRWCPDAPFGGELGGRALLPGATVVDVGQTAIKVSRPGHRPQHPRLGGRDVEHRSQHPRPHLVGRDALVAFVAGAIPPSGPLVLALPCGLDDDGTPGPCTYEGLDAAFIDDVLAASGRTEPATGERVVVLNDAELAALTARERLGDVRALVLTLGFGPGAALLEAGA